MRKHEKLRGVDVYIDHQKKEIYHTASKPDRRQFSLNDKFVMYMRRGYRVHVFVLGKVVVVDEDTKILRQVRVDSKFKNGNPYFLNWYAIDAPQEKQQDLFLTERQGVV